MNHITDFERVVSVLPKGRKKHFVKQIMADKLTISKAIELLIEKYIKKEVSLVVPK